MKINSITIDGPLRVERILNANRWRYTKHEWLHKHGIKLPTWARLKKAGWGFDDFRLLTEPVRVVIDFSHKGKYYIYEYRFDRRWITDFASVPKFFRGVIDNDDKQIIIAAMVHDAEFGNHWHGFRSANTLLLEIARYFGMNRAKSWLAWFFCSTPAGRRRWNLKRADWEKAGCEFWKYEDQT
jgi:hypothetical protein